MNISEIIGKFEKKSEFLRYIFVGLGAVVIDWACYHSFVTLFIFKADIAKRVSFILGSIWAFFANKYVTFKNYRKSVLEVFLFVMVFFSGFCLNGVIHDVSMSLTYNNQVAFGAATFVSTVTNYLGQKYIVFRKND